MGWGLGILAARKSSAADLPMTLDHSGPLNFTSA